MKAELSGICAYLTPRVAETVRYYAACGAQIEEIRLRRGGMISFTAAGKTIPTKTILSDKEFEDNFLKLSEYSLYAHADTLRSGYLSVNGGYRVGVCGHAILADGAIRNLSSVTVLNIRIPYRPSGISMDACKVIQAGFPLGGLIFSPPSGGKTTLLSDLAWMLSGEPHWRRVAVVDSRDELILRAVDAHTLDALCGYPKALGIEIATRTLAPEFIFCDEIGTEQEAEAMLGALHAGVAMVATTHAGTISELFSKKWVRQMHANHVFGTYIRILREDAMFYYHILSASEVSL